MNGFLTLLRRFHLHFWAIIIALALWIQVHGQGEGSLSLDVPLQVQGLPADMMLINDLPDHVKLTVKGLQTRIKELRQLSLTMPVDASDITSPGVVVRSLQLASVPLPIGVRIEKVQPDKLELQIDRVVKRSIQVTANYNPPGEWEAQILSIEPAQVELIGPEVWLEALKQVETTQLNPELKPGPFEIKAGVESPSSKAIRLADNKITITVKGVLKRNIESAPIDLPGNNEENTNP